jgi:ADP-heptose:LPS heptosyltransferase
VGTIGEFARWLTERPLFLGNNSGPMHVANALGCPGIVVTGATARGWDPYWHPDRWTVLRHPDLPCQPCERLNQELRGCRNLGNPLACLTYWTPEKVEAACRERLDFLAANPA